MARFGTRRIIGQASTPTSELTDCRSISGLSLAIGDASDVTGSSSNPGAAVCGWNFNEANRYVTLAKLRFSKADFAGHQIQIGDFYLAIQQCSFDSAVLPATFDLHAVRKTVDLSNITWALAATGVAWGQLSGQAGVDYDSTPLASFTIASATVNAFTAGTYNETNPFYQKLNIRPELQRMAERGSEVVLLIRPRFARLAGQNRRIWISSEATFGFDANRPHHRTEIVSTPALSFYGMRPDGSIDYGAYLDAALSDRDAHVDTGAPVAGGTGAPRGAGVANTTREQIVRVCVVGGHAQAGSVRQPSTGRTLKHFEPFNTTSTTKCQNGTVIMRPDTGAPSTNWKAWLVKTGSTTETPLANASAATSFLYSADTTLVDPDDTTKSMGSVLARFWGAQSVVGTEQWECEVLGDTQTQPLAADRHELAPFLGSFGAWEAAGAVAADRTAAWDGKWTKVSEANLAQLWANTYVATVDSVDRTHVPVRYGPRWTLNQRVTVFVPSTAGLTPQVHHATVYAIITTGANVDTLVLDRKLTIAGGATAVYGTDSFITSGVFLGDLLAPQRARLAAGLAPGALAFSIDSTAELAATGGQIRAYARATGLSEQRAFTREAASLSVTPALAGAYEADDPVVYVEALSWAPAYFRLRPEATALNGEQLAQVRALAAEAR